MITQIQAKNFKSWRETGRLDIAPMTGLFGANSSGKTSLLQMLLMLKQTAESPDRKRVLHTGDERSLADLGTFYDLIYKHQSDTPLDFWLSWNLPETLVIKDPEDIAKKLYEIKSLWFNVSIREESNRPVVDSFLYNFNTHQFGMRRKAQTKGKSSYDIVHGSYPARRVQGRAWPLPSPIKCYGFPDEATGYYQNTGFLPDFVLAFEGMLARTTYLGPLREYPKRTYVWAGERPIDVGRRGDQAIAALLSARAEGLRSGRGKGKARRYKPVEERVVEWLRQMGLIHSFSLKAVAPNRKDYELRIKKTPASAEVLVTDVGFGVSQILPVLVLCYYLPEGSTILLEQPEIHLHPSVQAGLADVFIDVVNERNIQLIIESHSEHLLTRLQRRIAEGRISLDKTALYFCSMKDGESQIDKLQLDPVGNITNWPTDFFGNEIGERIAMTEAAIKRQKIAAIR